MSDFFKGWGVILALCLVFSSAVLLLAVIFGGFDRVAAPFRAETDRQAYETSRAYLDGMAVDLEQLCRERALASDPNVKVTLADTIRLRSARVSSEKLPAHVQRCLEDVR